MRHGLAVVESDGGGDVRGVGAASDGALGVRGRWMAKAFLIPICTRRRIRRIMSQCGSASVKKKRGFVGVAEFLCV